MVKKLFIKLEEDHNVTVPSGLHLICELSQKTKNHLLLDLLARVDVPRLCLRVHVTHIRSTLVVEKDLIGVTKKTGNIRGALPTARELWSESEPTIL